MFTRIKLSAAEFKNALLDIKSIIGKGDSSVLLLFKTTGTSLMICTTAKCTYKNYLDIEEIDGSSVEVSINYKDVTQMLGSTGRVELEFTSYALVVYSNNIEISLPIGYGIMTEPKLPEVEFKEIPVSSYVSGLKSILSIGLSDIYKSELPIHIYKHLAVSIFPNIVIQSYVPSFPLEVALTPDYVKLIANFAATSVAMNGTKSMLLKKGKSVIEIPVRMLNKSNDFQQYMKGLDNSFTCSIEGYSEQLRNISKIGSNLKLKLVFHEKGLHCKAEYENTSISLSIGDTTSAMKTAMYVPAALYLNVIKAYGGGVVEFLYGKDIICIRNKSLITVLRAII